MRKYKIILLILIVIFFSNSNLYHFSTPLNEDIEYIRYKNQSVVAKKIYSYGNFSKLPKIEFAIYNIDKRYDDIYRVANYFKLNSDSIALVNNLYSIYLFQSLSYVMIPLYDGGFIKYDKKKYGEIINKIPLSEILRINNKTKIKDGDYLFVPFVSFTRNQKIYFNGSRFLDPLRGKGYITSLFGERLDPFSGNKAFHGGIDLGCKVGTPVRAIEVGKVEIADYSKSYGYYVVIKHDYGYSSVYGHLSKILVKKGDVVTYDTVIAKSGNTGKSTGPHLHFEIRYKNKRIDPLQYVIINKR